MQRLALSEYWGVDFSGDRNAGRYIWLTTAKSTNGPLRLVQCSHLRERLLARSVAELREAIAGAGSVLVGLDFPFGLPRTLVDETTWEEFIDRFGGRYGSPDAFRQEMNVRAGGRELRRVTDDRAKTPWSPYNLRLYKQTFYGIRDVITPLVLSDAVRVAPMQPPHENKALLVEVCPRSTRKAAPRKLPSAQDVLDWLGEENVDAALVRGTVLNDDRGDARDSTLAVFAAWRAAVSGSIASAPDFNLVEGYVFV